MQRCYERNISNFHFTKLDNLNTKSRGIGRESKLEHEVQLFHVNNKNHSVPNLVADSSNIIFDSQESTVFTRDTSKDGPCCKITRECYHQNELVRDIYSNQKPKITEDEKAFCKVYMQRTFGRQQKGCKNPFYLKEFLFLCLSL